MSDEFRTQSDFAPSRERPGMHQLDGRLLVIEPQSTEYAPDTANPGSPPKLRLIADVTFLDGPPIDRSINATTGLEELFETPVKPGETIRGMWISNTVLASTGEAALKTRPVPKLLGRLGKLPPRPGKSPATSLIDPTPEERATASRWLAARNVAAASQQFAAPAAPVAAPAAPVAAAPVAGPWG
jgi:hypothetical protein